MPEPLVEVVALTKEYRVAGLPPVALFRDLSFDVEAGAMLAVTGESGAGKSSLLHLLAGLDVPTWGEIRIGGATLTRMSANDTAAFRNREIGYVWQAHYLLPEFTALENVAMPLLARGDKAATGRALERLREVGLAERAQHRAGELSGGEQQRVALARALVGGPQLLLADEPTGNLDERTGEAIFALLQDLRDRHRLTVVLVTHNAAFASRCDAVVRLSRAG